MNARAAVAATLLVLTAAAGLAAQERPERELPRGSVSGVILDAESSAPLVGATVVVELVPAGALPGPAESGPGFLSASRGVLTDSAGRYRFEGLSPGRYRLLASRTGYRSTSIGVELRGSADSRVSVGLTVEPVALQAVEVVADRAQHFGLGRSLEEVESGSRTATARARQRSHLASDARELTHADVVESVTLGETDLFRALQRLPGVSTRDDFTAELWTRGASWDQTRVLFDGLPLYNPLHGMGLFSAVSPDAVGGAVLHPGVRPAALGPGAAGVLDIASRRGGGSGELRGTADLSLASVRVAADQRVLDGRGAWMVSGRRTYLDWISGAVSRLVDDPEAYVPYRFSDVAGRFDLQLAPGRTLEASALVERDHVSGDVPDVLHGTSAIWGNSAGRITYAAPLGGFSARHTLGVSRYGAAVRSREPRFDGQYSAPSERPSDNTLTHVSARGEMTALRASEEGPLWRLGYELVRQSSSYHGPQPRLYGGAQPSDTASLSRRSELTYGSAWGERRWNAGADVAVELGLRLDAGPGIADGGAVRIAPSVVARRRLSPDLSVSAGFGRSHQYTQALAPTGPSFHRNFSASQLWLLADQATPAIRSDIATVGAEAWLGEGWLAAVNGYLRRSSGLAVPDPTPGLLDGRPLFVRGENQAHGVELSARRLVGRWTASAGYSYSRSDIRAAGLRFPAAADRRHTVDLTAMARVGRGTRLGMAYTTASGAPYTRILEPYWSCGAGPACDSRPRLWQPNGQRTPAYASLDLLLDWTGTLRGWEVGAYLQLRNALGRDNATTYDSTTEICPGRGYTSICPTAYQPLDQFQPGMPPLPVFGVRVRF